MKGPWFSRNGNLEPTDKAQVALDDVNFTYGYGVYETLKIRKGILYFPDLHASRLLQSARIIGLSHNYSSEDIVRIMRDLVRANQVEDGNLKVLLIGKNPERPWGEEAAPSDRQEANLYMMVLNPLFPKRQEYRDGVRCLVACGERLWPGAKSLNMLGSTVAFREARSRDAHDALLMDRRGMLREGTRTNLFFTDGTTILTPPAWTVLEGVTRMTLLECCREKGYEVREAELALSNIVIPEDQPMPSLFLTSTSTRIMPVHSLVPADRNGPLSFPRVFGLDGAGALPWDAISQSGEVRLAPVPGLVRDLSRDYDAWLAAWAADNQE